MARITFRISMKGMPRTNKVLKKFGGKAKIARKKLLFDEATATVEQARPFTPIDTGELRRSGIAVVKSGLAIDARVEASFGGVKAPYGLIVHERMDLRHKAPTKAKYLEDVFNKRLRTMDTRFAREMRSLLPETQ